MIWVPVKDIAFSLPFLRCCLSFLSFQICLCRAWTPAAETRWAQISVSGQTHWRLATNGGGGWPFCPRRTCAQVSRTRPSLCWTIWIFSPSLSRPRVASLRGGWRCFWKNLGREGCILAPCAAVLDNDQSSTTHVLVPFSSFLRLGSWLVSRSLTEWSWKKGAGEKNSI